MANIRLKTITVEPTNILTIQNGDILITNTTISTNILNGALVIDGGISINNTFDSVSSTSGGAMTVGGGLGIHGQTYLGNNLILDNSSSIISVKGISQNRLFLDTVNNKNFYLSLDGVNKRFDLYDTYLQMNLTAASTNASTGAFIINGGISINNTTNAINSSNGGALTVAGGLAVNNDVFFSKSLTIGQLTVRYTGNSQIALQNSAGTANTTFNMNNNTLVISNSNDTIFNTSIGNFTFNNNNFTLFTIFQNHSQFSKYLVITDTVELDITNVLLFMLNVVFAVPALFCKAI